MQSVVISLGGSTIVPDKIAVAFLKKFKSLILKHKEKRFVIVCGGGHTCRKYTTAAKKIAAVKVQDLDLIGIRATKLNAELVRTAFGKAAHKAVIEDPTLKIRTDKRIIVGSGWKPGFSSDMDAVLLAKSFNAKKIINLSNIAHVYDKDPRKYASAKKIKSICWKDFRLLVGSRWTPGANIPFDPIASKLAQKLKLTVIIAKGSDLKNLENILLGKRFKGTVIKD